MECPGCGTELKLSVSVLNTLGHEWEWECFCGMFIGFNRVQ